ncbi:MAG: hypothetical protein M1825_004551 [Sarcosagium campestre]|nr:MAG: hypothetical protein M1825_004551 [Sarcosagium campestre]
MAQNAQNLMAKALAACRSKPGLLINTAAREFNVPRSTLQLRLRGIKSRSDGHEMQQTLSPAQEEALIQWIKNLN